KRTACTGDELRRSRKRHIGARTSRFPGAGADRCLRRHSVVSELTRNGIRTPLRHSPRRPAVRNGLTSVAGGQPIAPGRTQEFDEVRIVYAQYGLERELRGG